MIFVYKPLTLKKATPFFEQLPSKDWDPLKFGRRFTPPSPPPPPPYNYFILQEPFQLYKVLSVTYISNKTSNWKLNKS